MRLFRSTLLSGASVATLSAEKRGHLRQKALLDRFIEGHGDLENGKGHARHLSGTFLTTGRQPAGASGHEGTGGHGGSQDAAAEAGDTSAKGEGKGTSAEGGPPTDAGPSAGSGGKSSASSGPLLPSGAGASGDQTDESAEASSGSTPDLYTDDGTASSGSTGDEAPISSVDAADAESPLEVEEPADDEDEDGETRLEGAMGDELPTLGRNVDPTQRTTESVVSSAAPTATAAPAPAPANQLPVSDFISGQSKKPPEETPLTGETLQEQADEAAAAAAANAVPGNQGDSASVGAGKNSTDSSSGKGAGNGAGSGGGDVQHGGKGAGKSATPVGAAKNHTENKQGVVPTTTPSPYKPTYAAAGTGANAEFCKFCCQGTGVFILLTLIIAVMLYGINLCRTAAASNRAGRSRSRSPRPSPGRAIGTATAARPATTQQSRVQSQAAGGASQVQQQQQQQQSQVMRPSQQALLAQQQESRAMRASQQPPLAQQQGSRTTRASQQALLAQQQSGLQRPASRYTGQQPRVSDQQQQLMSTTHIAGYE
ncbi:unnamed protein product [Amoebophrya sp. A120]|nr:unnamed protein product [Amoebophrya sp. A120]|eukprot:GSA120T00016617001.1